VARTGWEFWIDRGGTFTDVVGCAPDGRLHTTKLLSESPEQYTDPAIEGIRRLLGVAPGEPLPAERIASVKMGTTVATNALLERKGEPTVLFITRGFRDQLRIGYQNRPKLFERQIRLPEPLYRQVVEVDERLAADGSVVVPLDAERLRADLEAAHAEGFRAAAIVFLHAFAYPEHEARAAELARQAGFSQISVSHRVSPLMKLVSRGDTTVVDAYLSPILRRYVQRVAAELDADARAAGAAEGARDGSAAGAGPQRAARPRLPLYFMQSNGGLCEAASFQGKDSILSGPAGGIVGLVRTALAAGFEKVIGFDMGGTSTDVSHFAGKSFADSERAFDTRVAGVRLRAPMMAIHTIAAGGGSILHFDGQKFSVGPDSAGANPGPACYRRGGPLTITDCNVLLGKIAPEFFPRVFGAEANAPLDVEIVRERFTALAREVEAATGRRTRPEEVAEGCLRIAVASMANAIQLISVQRGYDVTEYTLGCFGGAGGQHACLVADELGIERIFIHPLAGVLSAYGMGLADLSAHRQLAVERPLDTAVLAELARTFDHLAQEAAQEVERSGIAAADIEVHRRLHLKYEGTDTALEVPAGALASAGLSAAPEALLAELRAAFERTYRQRFAFLMPERRVVVEALAVEALGQTRRGSAQASAAPRAPSGPCAEVPLYTEGCSRLVPVFQRVTLAPGQTIAGPALIVEQNATTVIEPGWSARAVPPTPQPELGSKPGSEPGAAGAALSLLLERSTPRPERRAAGTAADPVLLEVFNNLFMSVAEQMGQRLANTAYSVNIKERLDFSCALFDAEGRLVANAPHMPVHLGSMGESIRTVRQRNAGEMQPGDVFVLNDPYNGGTHLPDVTVVMPVFEPERAAAALLLLLLLLRTLLPLLPPRPMRGARSSMWQRAVTMPISGASLRDRCRPRRAAWKKRGF
jgi:5-oxoprolinase (ATP-hydrolysing)